MTTGLEETQRELAQAHRDLAALMRSAPMANLRRLEQGVVWSIALRAWTASSVARSTPVRLSLPDDARAAADTLPPIVADLLLGATLEAIRNASKHARGEALHRPLTLEVELRADERWITTVVRDDGVGVSADSAAHGPEVASASTAVVAFHKWRRAERAAHAWRADGPGWWRAARGGPVRRWHDGHDTGSASSARATIAVRSSCRRS